MKITSQWSIQCIFVSLLFVLISLGVAAENGDLFAHFLDVRIPDPVCGDGTCIRESCSMCPEDCGECDPVCGNGVCNLIEDCSTCPADCCPPVCGDGTCNGVETCTSCSRDCGPCAPVCGDGSCNGVETCTTCVGDCGPCAPVCGDGSCNGAETCTSCSGDCGPCGPVCGDGACNGAETCASCARDCGPCAVCGDGTCNGADTCSNCPRDCGPCIYCGDGTCNGADTCSNCPADCGPCGPVCGDGACNGVETCSTCRTDCGSCVPACGDGVCKGAETCTTCSRDCGACPVCGDGSCNGVDTCSNCPADCGPCVFCGDGSCNGADTCSNCPADCGACAPSGCGNGVCNGNETCSTCQADCGVCCSREITCGGHGNCTLPPATDTCKCDLGWGGPNCSKCAPNYFGPNCTIFCNASTTCNNNGVCDKFSGQCKCNNLSLGKFCATTRRCEIRNGECDPRVTCHTNGTNVTCDDCPQGTNGTGYTECTSLCGNGICDAPFETCVTCPFDCKNKTCNECGDSVCDISRNETCQTCFEDCFSLCSYKPCPSNCSNHGVCYYGVCQCDQLWSGPSCSTSKAPITVQPNYTQPVISVSTPSLGESQTFTISIKSIVEYDGNMAVVQELSLLSARFTVRSQRFQGNNLRFNYSTELDNRALVHVIMWDFKEAQTLGFAGKNTTFTANTVKLGVRVARWPFRRMTHSLAIVMQSKLSQQGACLDASSSNGQLQYFMLVVGNTSLYGQFLDKAEIDGRVRGISFVSDQETITAKIPFFWDYADMDPQFSVLLGDQHAALCSLEGEARDRKRDINLLAVKIAVPVVGAAAIVAAVSVVLYPRLKTRSLITKAKVKSESSVELNKNVRM